MPSHKHKKKKKSHKRSKRNSSSSSENTNSPWRVPLSDADSDDTSYQEQLTPLVRRTYINYLKQALTLNFENCSKLSTEKNQESLEDVVHKWSSVLEQKALRTCMVSELYRTSMVSLIKQIKADTNNKKSVLENERLLRLKSKVPVNSSSQTDLPQRQEVETQTNLFLPSLLDLPLPKSSPSNIPYDPAIEFSDSNSSDEGVSSSLGSKEVQATSVVSGCQEICNISSTSDLIDLPELSAGENKESVAISDDFLNQRISMTGQFKSNFSDAMGSTSEPKLKNNTDNSNPINSTNENSCPKKLITLKKRRSSIENVQSQKNNLDERLSALGLLVDVEDSLPSAAEKSKKSNWFAEEIAQSCNLTRVLMRMTTKQRERVLKKIKELFGDEHGSLTELSEANISVCRKRIATVVVMELTPIYQAKKIGSRHLFKFLAKKITRSIMEKSLAPDTKSIRWRVRKYFEDGRVIMSESDCV